MPVGLGPLPVLHPVAGFELGIASAGIVANEHAQAVGWNDLLTRRASVSLGRDAYRSLLAEAGLQLERESTDEGGNHYFDAMRVHASDQSVEPD